MTTNIDEVSVGTSATQIVSSSSGRRKLIIKNKGNSTVFVADSNVTTSNGFPVRPEEEFDASNYQGAWYGIVSSDSEPVEYVEQVL